MGEQIRQELSMSLLHYYLLYFFTLLHLIKSIIRKRLLPEAIPLVLKDQDSHSSLAEVNGGYLPRVNSVHYHVRQGLSRNPDGLAAICLHQRAEHLSDVIEPAKCPVPLKSHSIDERRPGSGNCLAITYEQLDSTSRRLAGGLLSAGVQQGSTLLMLIPNGVEYALLIWCCTLLEITYVSVDPDIISASGYRALKEIMRSVKPSIVVTAGCTPATAIGIAIDDLRLSPPMRISLDMVIPKGWRSFKDLIRNTTWMDMSNLPSSTVDDNPNRINSIIFTSGTSGIPKGCPLRVSSMCQILESQSWLLHEENSARALQAAHNSRGIAAFQTLQTWKAGGAVMMIENSCDIKEMTAALRYHAPTFIAVSPSMASAIREEVKMDPFIADSVQTVQVGGEAVTIGALAECSVLFPAAKICVNHGMTEGGGSFQWPFLNTPLDQIPSFGEICPIGTVAPGSAIRVWNSSAECSAKIFEVGELHIRGGNLLRQYMGGRSPGSFFDDDYGHWLVTGDTAMIDRDGLVFILGRSRDMIDTKRGIIVPVAIEAVIRRFLGVQVVVLSIQHPTQGQVPLAVVKEYSRRTERDIITHVMKILGQAYLLIGVLSLKQLELVDFPRNGSGKVMKAELENAIRRKGHTFDL